MTRMRVVNKDKIVTGQQVKPTKVERAKRLRRRMTEEEKILWQHLRGNRLRGFHFRRQQLIDGFIVDFYCHAAGLVVEVDGEIHQQQAEYDAERDRALMARGLRVVRFKNEEVRKDMARVLERIEGSYPGPDLTPRPPSLKGRGSRWPGVRSSLSPCRRGGQGVKALLVALGVCLAGSAWDSSSPMWRRVREGW